MWMEGSVLWACKNRWFMLQDTLNASVGSAVTAWETVEEF